MSLRSALIGVGGKVEAKISEAIWTYGMECVGASVNFCGTPLPRRIVASVTWMSARALACARQGRGSSDQAAAQFRPIRQHTQRCREAARVAAPFQSPKPGLQKWIAATQTSIYAVPKGSSDSKSFYGGAAATGAVHSCVDDTGYAAASPLRVAAS